jgi:hypothetical protein
VRGTQCASPPHPVHRLGHLHLPHQGHPRHARAGYFALHLQRLQTGPAVLRLAGGDLAHDVGEMVD